MKQNISSKFKINSLKSPEQPLQINYDVTDFVNFVCRHEIEENKMEEEEDSFEEKKGKNNIFDLYDIYFIESPQHVEEGKK